MQTLGDVITWGLALAALIVVPYKIAKAWLGPIVKSFFVGSPEIMSRSAETDRPVAPSVLRQTEAQTADEQAWPILPRNEILDICKVLRVRGFSRDEARQLLRMFHQPLDNNLWTQAMPPDPEYVTPIAGRPTKAAFDADYPYEPLN